MANDLVAIIVLIVIGIVLYMQYTNSSFKDIMVQVKDAISVFKR